MFLLLKSFLGVSPDEPDDLAGDELGVEAKECGDPGDCLPLIRGCPHVPADQVVQQERQEQHCSPPIVAIGVELDQ